MPLVAGVTLLLVLDGGLLREPDAAEGRLPLRLPLPRLRPLLDASVGGLPERARREVSRRLAAAAQRARRASYLVVVKPPAVLMDDTRPSLQRSRRRSWLGAPVTWSWPSRPIRLYHAAISAQVATAQERLRMIAEQPSDGCGGCARPAECED